MPLVTWIMAALSRLIFSKAGAFITGAMVWLGLGVAAHTVITDGITDSVRDSFGGVPGTALNWLGFFGVDIYMCAVASAYVGASVGQIVLKRIAS